MYGGLDHEAYNVEKMDTLPSFNSERELKGMDISTQRLEELLNFLFTKGPFQSFPYPRYTAILWSFQLRGNFLDFGFA